MRVSHWMIGVILVAPMLAAAQTPQPQPPAQPKIATNELANFDRFLDSHPNVDRELRKNPSLINDPNYLSKHPDLRTFLSKHPNVQRDVTANPQRFMKAERKYDKKEDRAEEREERQAIKAAKKAAKQR